jgi:Domain of unknown function (DUF397)
MTMPHAADDSQPPATVSAQLRPPRWRKSRYSNSQGTCVEMALLPGGDIAVRNSRDPSGPMLVYSQAEIQALFQDVKDGEFDHLLL